MDLLLFARSKPESENMAGILGLLFLLLSHLICSTASPSPSSTTHHSILPSVALQESKVKEGVGGEKMIGSKEGRQQLMHSSKIGHGHGRGGAGEALTGRSPGSTGNNNGESTPAAQGGAAVIPVYTAGAVNNHRPSAHHGAAGRNQQSLEPFGLFAALVIILHVCGFET